MFRQSVQIRHSSVGYLGPPLCQGIHPHSITLPVTCTDYITWMSLEPNSDISISMMQMKCVFVWMCLGTNEPYMVYGSYIFEEILSILKENVGLIQEITVSFRVSIFVSVSKP